MPVLLNFEAPPSPVRPPTINEHQKEKEDDEEDQKEGQGEGGPNEAGQGDEEACQDEGMDKGDE